MMLCVCMLNGDTTDTAHEHFLPYKFSTNNCICILYFNICCELHIYNLILYNCTVAWLTL